MAPDDLKMRARRIAEELLTQGDLAVADELFTPDCRHRAPHSIPIGVNGVKPWVMTLRRAFPNLHAIVEDEITEGNTVVQRLTLRGTQDGEFRGLSPTGRHATWDLVEILSAGPDGTFVDHWFIWDELGLQRQLGAGPVAAEETP